MGDAPIKLIAEDFNNDDLTDLATLNAGEDSITILLGSGLGIFNEAVGSPFAVGHHPSGFEYGDFNNDGFPDLVSSNYEVEIIYDEDSADFVLMDVGSVSVLLGDGAGAFASAPGSPFDTEIAPSDVSIGDFNNELPLKIQLVISGLELVPSLHIPPPSFSAKLPVNIHPINFGPPVIKIPAPSSA